jgi:fucose permease
MSFLGVLPFGNLAAGALANKIGAPSTVMIGGIFCIIGSMFFAKQLPELRRLVRPVYNQLGLISKSSL